jgi:Putative lumazine-binding
MMTGGESMNRLLMSVLAVGALGSAGTAASADVDPEAAAIRATALNYIDGFYTGDAARMERAVHSELAKRIVTTDPKTGKSTLGQMSAMTLVKRTRDGIGLKIPPDRRQEDVTILDRFEDTANVKIVAADWVDYLQMAKFDGEWKIVNVLWVLKPKPVDHAP